MNRSPIPWLGPAGFTWNPVTGCHKGCDYCYARKIAQRFGRHIPVEPMNADCRPVACLSMSRSQPFPFDFEPTIYPHRLEEPLHRKKPATIFLGSMGDLFDPAIPDSFRDQVFMVVLVRPAHRFVVLTKRAQAMHDYFTNPDRHSAIFLTLPNLMLGVTVTNQADADERIPLLLETPAAYRMVSVEPMLGSVDLSRGLNIAWQCSGCRGYFSGPHQETCPDCGRKGYWCGSHKFNNGTRQTGSGLDFVGIGAKTPGPPLHEPQECAPILKRERYNDRTRRMKADYPRQAARRHDPGLKCPVTEFECGYPRCSEADGRPYRLRTLLAQCTSAGVPVNYKHANRTPEVDGVTHDATIADVMSR